MVKRVYVFEYDGKFKIGVSKNTDKRLIELSCPCPEIKRIYESDFLLNAFNVEGILHKEFLDFSVGGEWFSTVDIEKIKEIVENIGIKADMEKEKARQMKAFNFENLFGGIKVHTGTDCDVKTSNNLKEETQKIKEENLQLEKFACAIQGIDVPNVYSDLIYNVLFGLNTKGMIEKYKTRRFESLRNNLTDEQNRKIDNLISLIGGLINFQWNYEQIEDFVKTKIYPQPQNMIE